MFQTTNQVSMIEFLSLHWALPCLSKDSPPHHGWWSFHHSNGQRWGVNPPCKIWTKYDRVISHLFLIFWACTNSIPHDGISLFLNPLHIPAQIPMLFHRSFKHLWAAHQSALSAQVSCGSRGTFGSHAATRRALFVDMGCVSIQFEELGKMWWYICRYTYLYIMYIYIYIAMANMMIDITS